MSSISTRSEFESAINAEKALILIMFEWSGQAKLSEYAITEWRRLWNIYHKDLHIPFFKIEPDEYAFMVDWVGDEFKERGGCGSLVWIRQGVIVDYEPNELPPE